MTEIAVMIVLALVAAFVGRRVLLAEARRARQARLAHLTDGFADMSAAITRMTEAAQSAGVSFASFAAAWKTAGKAAGDTFSAAGETTP